MSYLILLTVIFTPLYEWRFKLLGLPANFLMLWVFVVWIIFIIGIFREKKYSAFFTFIKNLNPQILWPIALFLLSGLISLKIAGINQKTLGEFLVLFIQPISLYFIAKFCFGQNLKTKNYLLLTSYCLLGVAGLLAIFQYATGLYLPAAFLGNQWFLRRAVSVFSHANFYALFSAPLLALLIPDLTQTVQTKKLNTKFFKISAWVIGAVGMFLSLSRAGWLGLLAALIIYALVSASKKTHQIIFGLIILLGGFIYFQPTLNSRVGSAFSGEKSADSRLVLWQAGFTVIKKSPVLGAGFGGFASYWDSINNSLNLDTHNFPHNIFLDLWVETGLLGLISFSWLVFYIMFKGFQPFFGNKNKQSQIVLVDAFKLSVSLFLTALVVQGQFDNPYFKNDLAVIFFLVIAMF